MTHTKDIKEAIFETALNLEDPAARQAFLERTFTGDPQGLAGMADLLEAARGSVEFFLEAREQSAVAAGDILDEVPADALPDAPPGAVTGEGPGTRIDRYRLQERIGEGGCGVVYQAEQGEPVRRTVALKIIRLGMDTEAVIARFEAERQALAMMDHPSIAHIFDAGATATGRPYFVMELVQGEHITSYCDAQRLNLTARLGLFLDVCDAVQHAHHKGVIHRDIKPSNILVAERNGVAVPKVIDFGIAKATRGRLAGGTQFTARDQFIGTPAYMSPEQIDLGGIDVDTRSDIYSLGVLLYELLVGSTPFDGEVLLASGMAGMRRTLLEQSPPLPSTALANKESVALTEIAERRRLEPQRLISSVRGDLDWIVATALEKDRRRRYQTVNGLALDIQRFLRLEPVIARKPSRLYLIDRFVRRNRLACFSALAVVTSLVAGLGTAMHMYLRERDALHEQQRLSRLTEQMRAEESHLRQQAQTREGISRAAILWSLSRPGEAGEHFRGFPPEMVDPTPEDAVLFQSLGEWNAGCDRWPEAVWCFKVCLRSQQLPVIAVPGTHLDLLGSRLAITLAGPAMVMAGELAGYDDLRRNLLDQLGAVASASDVDHVLKACLLTPADGSLLARLTPLAGRLEAALKGNDLPPNSESRFFYSTTLAMFEYRRGNDPQCLALAARVLENRQRRPERDACDHCLAGLVGFRQGDAATAATHIAAAKDFVDRAYEVSGKRPNRKVDKLWFEWAIARILLHEAETAAKIDAAK